MKYNNLSNDSKTYVNKICRSYNLTKEEAMKDCIVIEVLNTYEREANNYE